MPLAGDLTEMTYVGGRLFSVNQATAALVPGLFARNERVLCLFGTDAGPMAVVLVGAIFVGGIETVWEGEVAPALPGLRCRRWHYTGKTRQVRLERGAELGRFNLGSTIVLLFPAGAVTWDPALAAGSSGTARAAHRDLALESFRLNSEPVRQGRGVGLQPDRRRGVT